MAQPQLFGHLDVEEQDELTRRDELGQFMTPGWVAHEVLASRFGDLSTSDLVLEPSCGTGAFLHAMNAVHPHVPAVGVEIDPILAAQARRDTGRRVITGDFATVELDIQPTAIIGNPPYSASTISAFLTRSKSLLPEGGRVAFLMPVHTLSFAKRTLELTEGFRVEHELIPRDLWPRIRIPLMFTMFTKERRRKLVGFFLYDEAASLNGLRGEYRAIAESSTRPVWRDVVERAIRELGGTASLSQIEEIVEHRRPTQNRFWRDKIRQVCHQFMHRVDRGVFSLAAA